MTRKPNKRRQGSSTGKPNVCLSVSDKNVLVEVFNALGGVVSEMGTEFFDQYHSRGGFTMMSEFEKLLKKVSPESFAEDEKGSTYFRVNYSENNVGIEIDLVPQGNVEAWFKDSYRHHTAKEPTVEELSSFQKGIPVIVTVGNVVREWTCEYFGNR